MIKGKIDVTKMRRSLKLSGVIEATANAICGEHCDHAYLKLKLQWKFETNVNLTELKNVNRPNAIVSMETPYRIPCIVSFVAAATITSFWYIIVLPYTDLEGRGCHQNCDNQ